MKNIIKKAIFSILMLSFGVGYSFAKEDADLYDHGKTCDYSTQAALMSQAKEVTVGYEESTTSVYEGYDPQIDDEGYDEKRYINLKIYNVGRDISVSIRNETANKDIKFNDLDRFSYSNTRDGVMTVTKPASNKVYNYTIKIYGFRNCGNVVLRTIRYSLPATNPYSDFEICQDVPEFYLCQPLITTPISNSIDVPAEVSKYKEKLAEKGIREEEQKDNTPKISKIISDTSKKKVGFVIVLLTIGIGFTVFILYRRKNGAK